MDDTLRIDGIPCRIVGLQNGAGMEKIGRRDDTEVPEEREVNLFRCGLRKKRDTTRIVAQIQEHWTGSDGQQGERLLGVNSGQILDIVGRLGQWRILMAGWG